MRLTKLSAHHSGFLGKHHTEKSNQKNRLSHLGKCHSEEHNRKIGLAQLGVKKSPEHVAKLRYNFLGKHHSEETKFKIRLAKLGKKQSNDDKQKKSIAHLKLFKDEEYVKKYMQAHSKKPTKPEIKLNDILQNNFQNEWKYVGDFKFWVDGKNPDFVNVNGKKLIIELFGDYYHRNDDGQKRIAHFAKYGYKTLIIWEHEVYQDTQLLLQKLSDFCVMSNDCL